jgi:hypothetical protein
MTDEVPRSEPPASIAEFHDQDWLIVIEALADAVGEDVVQQTLLDAEWSV